MRAARFMLVAAGAAIALALPSSVMALAPVGPGVVGLWQAEGDASDPFNGHGGALLGGAALSPFTAGQAFSFTGAQQAVDVPDAADLYPTDSFTVAGWVRTANTTDTQTLIAHYECGNFCPGAQASSMFGLWVTAGHAEGFVRDSDSGGPMGPPDNDGQDITGGPLLADGADHHLALVRDTTAAELRLIVDGVLVASAPLNGGATGPLGNFDGEADDLYLGSFRRCLLPQPDPCDGTLVNQLSGLLDDVVYWSRAVPTAELAAIRSAGPNGLTTDLSAPASAASSPASIASGPIPVTFTAADAQGPAPRVHDPSNLARVDLYARAPGQAAFTQVASTAGAATGVFSYATGGPGDYAFATVAVDAAGNAEALPSTPDAVTNVPAPAARPVTPAARPRDPVRIEQVVVGLPSTRRCLSRRAFTIHLKIPEGVLVRSATVFVNQRSIAVRRGAKLTAPVSLKGLPKGKYTVKIVLRLASGKTLTGSRHYRTCTPRRR